MSTIGVGKAPIRIITQRYFLLERDKPASATGTRCRPIFPSYSMSPILTVMFYSPAKRILSLRPPAGAGPSAVLLDAVPESLTHCAPNTTVVIGNRMPPVTRCVCTATFGLESMAEKRLQSRWHL